ncbi:MAG: sugar phosphate isomerase/epimerase [Candidatus Adiutrix sp.]|jgi:sugar phosphate isomerase/epimerase|nr:sugar phosphate isomerase/epimerase [Candidatus Adiutrix sp.]
MRKPSSIYASLFVTWLIWDNGHFGELLRRGVAPEIGLEHGGFDVPLARHRETAVAIRDHGLAAAIHLPYTGIRPGAGEARRWEAGREQLMRALEIAAIYEPDHLIGHPEFRPGLDSAASIRGGGPGNPESLNRPAEPWLERSARLWGEALVATEARLFLENTVDRSPTAIMSLLERLPERAGMCFDVGHWFSAADGSTLHNLPQWIAEAAPRLRHLHLHDNHGQHDEHLGLGWGEIDFDEFFRLLKAHNLHPSFTLEAHTIPDLDASLAAMKLRTPL